MSVDSKPTKKKREITIAVRPARRTKGLEEQVLSVTATVKNKKDAAAGTLEAMHESIRAAFQLQTMTFTRKTRIAPSPAERKKKGTRNTKQEILPQV